MIRVRTVYSNNVLGMKYFEIIFENEEGHFLRSASITLSQLKKLDVAKTMNSTKKVRDWSNSEAGQAFLFGKGAE